MKSLAATTVLHLIKSQGLRFFRTSDILTLTRLNPSAASHALHRLADKNLLTQMKRGVWANRLADPLDPAEAVQHLTFPAPSSISLYTALSRQGVIDEVPRAIYAVTTGRPARLHTPLGDFHIHHLPARLFWGIQQSHSTGGGTFPMAEKEKAFLDLAYLGLVPRSPLGVPYSRRKKWDLDLGKLRRYTSRFGYLPLNNFLLEKGLLNP
jgi:predicted transcriptional regulator of viral defense system